MNNADHSINDQHPSPLLPTHDNHNDPLYQPIVSTCHSPDNPSPCSHLTYLSGLLEEDQPRMVRPSNDRTREHTQEEVSHTRDPETDPFTRDLILQDSRNISGISRDFSDFFDYQERITFNTSSQPLLNKDVTDVTPHVFDPDSNLPNGFLSADTYRYTPQFSEAPRPAHTNNCVDSSETGYQHDIVSQYSETQRLTLIPTLHSPFHVPIDVTVDVTFQDVQSTQQASEPTQKVEDTDTLPPRPSDNKHSNSQYSERGQSTPQYSGSPQPRPDGTEAAPPLNDQWHQTQLTTCERTLAIDRGLPLHVRITTFVSHFKECDPSWLLNERYKRDIESCYSELDELLEITQIPHTPKVINLSNRTLDPDELSLLQKGLSFCPTPGEPKMGDLVRDLDHFHDTIRWQYYFRDNPTEMDPFDKMVMTSKALKKHQRYPPPPAHRNIEAFIFLNERDLQKQKLMEPQVKNLTQREKLALKTLKGDPHITIKADKGGAVVILNTSDYISEAHRQLADRKFYRPVDHDMTEEFSDRIETYLSTLHKKGSISKCIYDRITTPNPRTPAFYHNPKVHKDNTHLGIPPGRPIISGNGCATEKISAFIDLCLNPLVPKIPSFVRDSTHFITLLQQHVRNADCHRHTLLVTLDVTALYTIIPHEEGIEAVRELIRHHRSTVRGDLQIRTITTLLRMVLQMNNF